MAGVDVQGEEVCLGGLYPGGIRCPDSNLFIVFNFFLLRGKHTVLSKKKKISTMMILGKC